MLAGVAFTVLLFLISGVSAGVDLPPTDVTLSCTNQDVIVSWKYQEQQPQTSFRVHIAGSEGDYVTETTDHQYNLSHFVWESEERYLGFHYVNVTAIQDGSQSKVVQSETFTFNDLKYAQRKCGLDFPPVDLNENDSGATVSFVNPLYFYSGLKQAVKPDTVTLSYKVFSDGVFKEAECTAMQEKCKYDISFPEGVEKCVNLTGHLKAGNRVGAVGFRDTGRVCLTESTELHAVVFTVMLFILAIIIGVIIFCICKARAWTMKIPGLPGPLTIEPKDHSKGDLKYAPVLHENINELIVSQPCKNPSISSEEENHPRENLDSSAGSSIRHPDGLYMEGGLSEEYGRGDDSANSSVKTETVSIDLEEEEEEEEEASPYDSPQTLQVDMGDGDMVECYSKRERRT